MVIKPTKNAVGQAGVYRVMSELLLRGHNPAIFAYDDGVDILLENGKTVQVKTSNKATKRKDVYYFQMDSYMKLLKNISEGKFTGQYRLPDFFIFWGIDDSECIILPKEQLPNKVHISISLNPKRKGMGARKNRNPLLEFKNKWELLN